MPAARGLPGEGPCARGVMMPACAWFVPDVTRSRVQGAVIREKPGGDQVQIGHCAAAGAQCLHDYYNQTAEPANCATMAGFAGVPAETVSTS